VSTLCKTSSLEWNERHSSSPIEQEDVAQAHSDFEETVCRAAPCQPSIKDSRMKTDRTIVITGAAGGMGAAFVERFLDHGDTVIATDTSGDALGTLAASAPRAGRLHVQAADITRDGDLQALAALAMKERGGADVLIHAAGYFPTQPFLETTPEDWRRIVDINLTGTALVSRALLPQMIDRGWGRIINIGSASIYGGVSGQAPYVAAKAGVVGLTRSLAREFGASGITVNVVAPGVTLTPAARRTLPQRVQDAAIAARSLPREEGVADLVGAVFFLASPEADFITGQTLVVDGGSEML